MTYRIMTVCTGNICRSPMAEVVLRTALMRAGLGADVEVFSTGTSSEEQGNGMDRRARAVLRAAGYQVGDHVARRVTPADVASSDLIVTATSWHARTVRALAHDEVAARRVVMLRSFDFELAQHLGERAGESAYDLDDPWYGSHADFVATLEAIEAAAGGVVEHVRRGGCGRS